MATNISDAILTIDGRQKGVVENRIKYKRRDKTFINTSPTARRIISRMQGNSEISNGPFSPTLPNSSRTVLSSPLVRLNNSSNSNSNSNGNGNNKNNNNSINNNNTNNNGNHGILNNANNSSSYSQLDSVLSPLLTNSINSPLPDITFSPHLGQTNDNDNDIPAFNPKTEMMLENYTNNLNMFNTWIKNLSVEEQKTAIGMFIESIESPEILEFIKLKVSSIESQPKNGNDHSLNFSPPLSATSGCGSLSNNLRPVSPIISMSSINHSNPDPLTLDSLLNDTSDLNLSMNHLSLNNDIIYNPAPRRALSPPSMKTGFGNLIEPIERPKSAGPSYSHEVMSGVGSMGMSNMDSMNGMLNVTNNGNILPISNLPMNSMNDIGAKLQTSLNTINNRSLLDSNKVKDDRRKFLQNRMPVNGMNGISSMTNLNSMMNVNMHMPVSYNNGHGIGMTNSPPQQHHHLQLQHVHQQQGNKPRNKGYHKTSPLSGGESSVHNNSKKNNNNSSNNNSNNNNSNINENNGTNLPRDIASDALLEDIPAWLKTLRLHKYTDNLKHLKWQEMVVLDDEGLTSLGVSTVGARNKLLKSFKYVCEQKGLSQ